MLKCTNTLDIIIRCCFIYWQKKKSAELDRIMGELKVDSGPGDDSDDLLDLMDSAQ